MSERLAEDLCLLTQQVMARTGSDTSGGLLGGAFGYGAYYENDVFMMHPYCWCERADCPWCRGCECEGRWDTPDGTYRQGARWVLESECANCTTPTDGEPNFRHKASGVEVHWYKYIGRGMETSRTPSHKEWRTILSECLASIGQPSIEDAREEYDAACDREAEKFEEAMEWAASPEGQAEFDRMVESGAITVLEFGSEAPSGAPPKENDPQRSAHPHSDTEVSR